MLVCRLWTVSNCAAIEYVDCSIVATSKEAIQSSGRNKISYKLKFELEKLPAKIEKLEAKIAELSEELSQTQERNSANLAQISMEIAKHQKELETAEERWLELEEISDSLNC